VALLTFAWLPSRSRPVALRLSVCGPVTFCPL